MAIKHYTLKQILSFHALYNIIFGERSNGKTYAVQEYGIEHYIKYGEEMAIIRRWEEDFKGKNGATMFDGQVSNTDGRNNIERLTGGEYNGVFYYSERFYLARYENGEKVQQDSKPFCYAFALTKSEHYKMSSFPRITTILFDEFLTRSYYLPDEFISFTSILSTIIRLRTNVTVFMCGNTVNKYCPYFAEMGLKNIKTMQKGKIDVYSYPNNPGLKVAVEYSDFPTKEKKSNVYFAFDNPKLDMVKTGAWEIGTYPHLPRKYNPTDIIYRFYIDFDGEMLDGEVIYKEDVFVYMHRRTKTIPDDTNNIIYTLKQSTRPNLRRNILHPVSNPERKITQLLKVDKFFYQDNEIGEIMRNYIMQCQKMSIV